MKRTMALVAGMALAAGIAACGSTNTTALQAEQRKLKTAQSSDASLRSQVSSPESQLATARTAASQATSIANDKAAAAYALRTASLNRRASSLNSMARQIAATEGQLQASRISGDGVYVVGKDIKPGLYHTNGSGNTGANDCYFATLNSTDTSNIADNNNFDGPETVDVSGAYAFQISGPCVWVRVG